MPSGVSAVVGKVAIKVIPDTQEFRRELQRDLKKRLAGFEVKVKVTPELDLKETKKTKDKLERELGKLKSRIRPEVDEASKVKAQMRLILLSRARTATIVPVVSRIAYRKAAATLAALSGGRVLNKYVRDFNDFLANLDKKVPKIAAVGLGITNLSGYALTAASNLFAMSRSLAQIGQASLALPGILGGLIVGIGASVAVLKDFNKVIPELGDKLHKLQDQMSSDFWNVAEKPIRKLIDDLFPKFSRGIRKTSKDLGTFFGNFATSLGGKFDNTLLTMFDNLNKSIRIASESTDAYAGILATLGQTGSQYLPRLADWFGRISTDFDAWLTDASADGRLQEWIDHGIFELKELGRVLHGLGSTLSGLANAAEKAGGSSFTQMADTLERVAKVVNGEKFQRAMTQALASAHKGMSEIAKESGPQFKQLMLDLSALMTDVMPSAGNSFGTALGALFDALSRPASLNGLRSAFESISNAINTLAPAMPKVGDAFGALVTVIGRLSENVSKVLARAIPIVTDAMIELAPVVMELSDVLSDLLTSGVSALAPIFKGIVAVLKPLVKLVSTLADLLNKLPKGMKDIIVQAAALTVGLRLLGITGKASLVSMAETGYLKMSMLGDSIKQVGVKALAIRGSLATAGIGLMALGSSGEHAESKLGKLLTIGGSIATGWAVGGPIGAAVAGSVSIFSTFASGSDVATEAQRRLQESMQSVYDQIIANNGLIDDQARFDIWKNLRNAGGEEVAAQLKLSFKAIFDAATGQEEAIAQVQTAVTEYLDNIAASGRSIPEAWAALEPVIGQINGVNQTVSEASQTWKNFQEDLKETDTSGITATMDATKPLYEQMGALRAEWGNVERAANTPLKPSISPETTSAVDSIIKNWHLSLTGLEQLKIDPEVLPTLNDQQLETIRRRIEQLAMTDVEILAEVVANTENVAPNLQAALDAAQKNAKLKVDADTSPLAATLSGLGAVVAEAVGAQRDTIKRAGEDLGNAGAGGARNARGEFASAGKHIAAGLAAGLDAGRWLVSARAAALGALAAAAARKALKVQSPSKVFMEIGDYIGQGLAKGIEKSTSKATRAASRMAEAVSATFDRDALDRNLSVSVRSQRAGLAAASAALSEDSTTIVKQFNYYAAENNSLSAEEDLFRAAERSRMVI